MAKNDTYSSRRTALLDEEPEAAAHDGNFYRSPAAKAGQDRPRRTFAPGESSSAADVEDGREESGFLRTRRRVPIRRGLLPRSRWGRIALGVALAAALGCVIYAVFAVRSFLRNDPRFLVDSASSIQILGNSQVTRPELLAVFGSDIGRNIFFIPLAERQKELEQLPWVEHATVMRLLPNQLRVSIRERTPVAFLRQGGAVSLIDAHGVLLPMTPAMMAARHYSFPVVTGISAANPLTVRAARMQLYQKFVGAMDAGGGRVSEQLSEVDLSDPEDVRALLPAAGSDILVHFGEDHFLERYQAYQRHIAGWKQQYPRLASVDMRYDSQVVLEMAKPPAPAPAHPAVAHAKAPAHKPAAKHGVSRAQGHSAARRAK